MRVFKFGGASLRDAAGVKNVAEIISSAVEKDDSLIIVVSAMGSTTDCLEEMVARACGGNDTRTWMDELYNFHKNIINGLFPEPFPRHAVHGCVEDIFGKLVRNIRQPLLPHFPATLNKAFYDQIVSTGEILSTKILYHYLLEQKTNVIWQDAREIITTDEEYGNANIHWRETIEAAQIVKRKLSPGSVMVIQGFIGRTQDGWTTTLGREGSDFSAAVLACALDASSITLWKDVPGLMNGDPKKVPDAEVVPQLPYGEAAEMMYYGANLIHTKTIQPLAKKGIPLLIKSFVYPLHPGTVIDDCHIENLPVMYVYKENQALFSCKRGNGEFISEYHSRQIFTILHNLNLQPGLVQKSALSFSFCIDFNEEKIKELLDLLRSSFEVTYNTDLTLVTIKNYNANIARKYRQLNSILIEQTTRSTLQLLVKTSSAFPPAPVTLKGTTAYEPSHPTW